MAADDFMESEVAIAAAATAVLFSPRVREVARRGVVYGMAGVITAGRALTGLTREAGRAVGSAMPSGPGTGSAATATTSRSRPAGTTRRPRSTAGRSKPAARGASRGARSTADGASGSGAPAASAGS